jgi:hypothetical protein
MPAEAQPCIENGPRILRSQGNRQLPRQTRHRSLVRSGGNPGGRAFFRTTVAQLPGVYEEISEILRSQYVIWYRPNSDKAPDKFRSIKVKVDNPKLKVRTISGYYPGR